MSTGPTVKLSDLSSDRRRSALRAASETLAARGGMVVTGSEAGYVALAADGSDAARALRDWVGLGAWWCPSAAIATTVFPTLTPVQRRVLRKLEPGGVLWRIGLPEGVHPQMAFTDAIDPRIEPHRVCMRLADSSVASTIAGLAAGPDQTGRPAPAIGVWALSAPDGAPCRTCTDAHAAITRLHLSLPVETLIDSGPSDPTARGLTIVYLNGAGGVHVEREGAHPRRHVLAAAALNVLFVCTGNTCRSPMAEAIGNGLARQLEAADPIRFSSAGVSAGSGSPPTPEAVEAVQELDFSLAQHRSRPLTRQQIHDADVIYTMTASHLHAVLAMDPGAADRASLLDPSGADIDDPIGQGRAEYTACARKLRSLLEMRLQEIAP